LKNLKIEISFYPKCFLFVDKDLILVALITAVLGIVVHLAFVLRTMCQGKPSKTWIFTGSTFLFLAGKFFL